MPPKKQQEAPAKVYFGRVGSNLQCGIVGLANVGKSTLFNVMTENNVPAENYPFCTIDPSTARVAIPDERFEFLCEKYRPARRIPAFLQVTDIAGLIRGAASGQGLGNAFLSHIRATDAIFHVARAFEDETVTHTESSIDPIRDMEIVAEELRLKDIETLEKLLQPLERVVHRNNDKVRRVEYDCIHKCIDMLRSGRDIRFGEWTPKEVAMINPYCLLSCKPVCFIANLSERDYLRRGNRWLPRMKAWIDEHCPGEMLIPISAQFEYNLMQMDAEERAAYLTQHRTKSMLSKVITVGYSALNLIHFFTVGPDEVKCWTIRRSTKAPQAAGTIHTDFERGFICAETMAFADFQEHGDEQGVRAAGKYLTKGKDYEVADGDILLFKAGQSQKKKK